MKDFFIVAHKYVTNTTADLNVELGTKSWHLNLVIKWLALSQEQALQLTYSQLNSNNQPTDTDSDTLDFDNERN